MADPALTTVVMPVWDSYVDRFLPKALDNVLAEEGTHVVVVDNASRHPVPEHPGVEVVRAPRRLTRGAARNLGLSAVRTETVMFWDVDDVLLEGTVGRLRGVLDRHDDAVAATAAILQPPALPYPWPRAISRSLSRRPNLFALGNVLTSQYPTTGSVLLRTDCVRAAGGFADSDGADDWVLGVSLAFRGRVVHDPRPGRIYLPRPDSASAEWRPFPHMVRHARLVRRRLRDDRGVPPVVRAASGALVPLQLVVLLVVGPLARSPIPRVGAKARVYAAILWDAYVRPRPRAEDGPLVTVIIAAYNRSEVLRFALASALAQTYRRLEVLVVGDACTDESEQVVADAADPRVRWMNLERNTGSQSGPNNAGLEAARGDLIAYLGQDDLWRPDHVALLVADLERSGADVTAAAMMNVWPPPLPARGFSSPPPGGYIGVSALMHTAAAGRAAGGWRDYRETVLPPDADLIMRLRDSGATFSTVRAVSVVKFASWLRPGSYRDGRYDEQATFSKRVGRRSFVARELLAAAATTPFRRRLRRPDIPVSAAATPGGTVAEYRRIRGLDRPGESR
jgi:glycosyltransferase involved in cell wall biosynthesis